MKAGVHFSSDMREMGAKEEEGRSRSREALADSEILKGIQELHMTLTASGGSQKI